MSVGWLPEKTKYPCAEGAGKRPRRGERRGRQVRLGEDTLAEHVTQRAAGHGLDHQPCQEVVGVRVVVGRAGVGDGVVAQGDADQAAWRPDVPQVTLQVGSHDAGVLVEVEDTAGVVEKLADGDARLAGEKSGQVAARGVAEVDPVLRNELQDGRRHVGFREAADPVAVLWNHRRRGGDVGEAALERGDRAVVVAVEQGAGSAVRDQLVERLLQLSGVRAAGGVAGMDLSAATADVVGAVRARPATRAATATAAARLEVRSLRRAWGEER